MSTISIKMTLMSGTVLAAAEALLAAYYEEAGDTAETVGSLEEQTVLAAHDQDELLGFATVSYNAIHPQWIRPFVLVAPDHRRHGIGTALHEALWERLRYSEEAGLQFGCSQADSATQAFLQTLGYTLRLESHTLCFEITPEHFQPAMASATAVAEAGLTLASFHTLAPIRHKLLSFLVGRYRAEHFWSPPIDASNPLWKEVVFDDLNPDLSFALMQGDQIVAAATAESSGGVLGIMWAYAHAEDSLETRATMLRSLIAHQLDTAYQQGLREGDIEIDSTDTALSALRDEFSVLESDVWQIYQKQKEQAEA
jgi:GNAT superfamily N-acetyltransferase